MARKLQPGEEVAFSQHQPVMELVFDGEEHDSSSSRRKVNHGWPKSRPLTAASEEVQQEGTGPNDDWF